MRKSLDGLGFIEEEFPRYRATGKRLIARIQTRQSLALHGNQPVLPGSALDIDAMLCLARATIWLRRRHVIDLGKKLYGKLLELLPVERRLVELVIVNAIVPPRPCTARVVWI